MTPNHWHGGGLAAKDLRVTPEDKQRLIEESARMSAELPAGDALVMEWSEEEVLFLQEPQRIYGGAISAGMQLILGLSMSLMILRIAFEGIRMVKLGSADKVEGFAV